jgi:hypothetical protein
VMIDSSHVRWVHILLRKRIYNMPRWTYSWWDWMLWRARRLPWQSLLMLWMLAWPAKSVVILGNQGITSPLPRRMWCTWTTTTMVIIHKEVKHGISHALTNRGVIKVILTVPTNLPWKI